MEDINTIRVIPDEILTESRGDYIGLIQESEGHMKANCF